MWPTQEQTDCHDKVRLTRHNYAQFLKTGLESVLIIPTFRANLVLWVTWQCDRFGTTPVLGLGLEIGFTLWRANLD